MKTNILKRFLLVFVAVAFVFSAARGEAIKREHRSVWMSAFVSDWPSGKITESNAAAMKRACDRMLDTLKTNNMNAVYFHVRAMCDALYNSAYEPWSSYIVATRGDVPAFDPLEYIIEQSHKRGIELYAWVNPYRYGHGSNLWGQSELDYVHTHPDWLLTTDYETVLNPGIPEVRQRVVDVCKDIITKYDVDGLVFDDYFYNQGGSDFSLDADLYNAYRASGGTLSQGDWRRENVNQMVADVNQMVKETKPWVRFGIGPAGVACSSPDVAAKYGVDPSPGSDWQYNQIYSDPMAWVTRGTIDFISPQVYWNTAGTYDEVTGWWGMVGNKFNRHVYISGYAVDGKKDGWDLDEYVNQVRIMRESMKSGVYGMVYFKYTTWRMLNGNINGKVRQLRHYLRDSVYTTPSISPAMSWVRPPVEYGTVTNLSLNDGTLSWDSVPNVRYAVYAIPDTVPAAEFKAQAEYLLGLSYSASFTPDARHSEGFRYAVSIVDRYENEFAAIEVGATPVQAEKPALTYPADGAEVPQLAFMQWTGNASEYRIEIFNDAEMTDFAMGAVTAEKRLAMAALTGLKPGNTYYWRVTAQGAGTIPATSDLQAFTLVEMNIKNPVNNSTGVAFAPTFTWVEASPGTEYLLEISTLSNFATIKHSATTQEPTYIVPRYTLAAGRRYYARVTATLEGTSITSPVCSFTTVDCTPAVPQFIVPDHDGGRLYSNSKVEVAPEDGVESLRVEISSSNTFPARTSYRPTITDGFVTPELGTITGTGKLSDGKTYYLRARFAYSKTTESTTQYTEYTPILTFTYRATPYGDVNGDSLVNVTDVNLIVSDILTQANNLDCDINGDGQVNVTDVNLAVSIILTQK